MGAGLGNVGGQRTDVNKYEENTWGCVGVLHGCVSAAELLSGVEGWVGWGGRLAHKQAAS